MKKLMTFAVAVMAACACAEIKAVATDVGDVPMTAEDEVSSRFRISGGAVGRFGLEGHFYTTEDLVGRKKHSNLYGIGLDVQYKLLEKDGFNLWLGLGGRFLPEQDVVNVVDADTLDVSGITMSYSYARKVEMKAYDLRVMLIPEWELTSSLALGARIGFGCTHYRGEIKHRFDVDILGHTEEGKLSFTFSETKAQGILGLQATWMLSDHVGLYAYGDGIIGGDAKIAEDCVIDGCAFEAGVGVTVSF